MNVWNHSLHELKDEELIVVKHIFVDENEAEIFTNNTIFPMFNRNIPKFGGVDMYMKKRYSRSGALNSAGTKFLTPVSNPGK